MKHFLVGFLLSLIGVKSLAQSSFLQDLMKQSGKFEIILENPSKYKVQIIYTQINRNKGNIPTFNSFYYQLDSSNYFYPASTIKLPTVLMALEKVNKIGKFDKNVALKIDPIPNISDGVEIDSTSKNKTPSIAHYSKKIFLVSDNDAFNRLYEFVGQENLNNELKKKGYNNIRISHRLGVSLKEYENALGNSFSFYNKRGKELYFKEKDSSKVKYSSEFPIKMGKGFYKNETLINEPFDFTSKNCFGLMDQQSILKSIIFPKSIVEKNRFDLKYSDYRFLYKYMSEKPSESQYPKFDSSEYCDSYVNFFMFGNSENKIPPNIRIFNKVGEAYGFLIDNAYIVDFKQKVEFMLSAVIYCNEDEVFNDDKYEYEEIGMPFFENLGNLIYNYELSRKKSFYPNLRKFKIKYN